MRTGAITTIEASARYTIQISNLYNEGSQDFESNKLRDKRGGAQYAFDQHAGERRTPGLGRAPGGGGGGALYGYCRWRLGYWRRRGCPRCRARTGCWHYGAGLLLRAPPAWLLARLYRAAPDQPLVGFYICHKPCLLLRDPLLVKPEGQLRNDQPVRAARAGLALRAAAHGARAVGLAHARRRAGHAGGHAPLLARLAGAAAARSPADAQELGHRYAADLIARVALGARTDSFSKPDAYTDNALEFFSGMRRMVALVVVFFTPWLAALAARAGAPLYFEFREARRLFREAWAAREGAAPAPARAARGDFLDYLRQLKEGPQNPLFEFSGDNLLYQAGMFFSGFESSAAAATFLLRALARRPPLAARARDEVRRAVRDAGGWGARALEAMPLLARCLKEALRMHPPVATLDRRATTDYQRIPGTDVTIERGTAVYISLSGLQMDPVHFPARTRSPRALRRRPPRLGRLLAVRTRASHVRQ
ncbi:cytochrome P450 6k1-like [Choristoneura fumiferana]|uniref:cytochrome P450 6k1-like n=1 Tax=Choristoneura fumiferana TaxID=7141 RepID=UPI003D1573E5